MNEKKPFITICCYCQQDFPEVDKAIKYQMTLKDKSIASFSHGLCKRHFIEMLREIGDSEDQIMASMPNIKNSIPDLKERPDLVKSYYDKFHDPELDKKSIQESNNKITNRFKKLAGIKS